MKYIKVVIYMTIEVPDDTEIVTPEGDDNTPYVQINGRDYTPTYEWLKRIDEHMWTSRDDEEYEEWEEVTQIGTMDASIQVISAEEFREAMPQE